MPITFPTSGPLQQVHDALWALLEASQQFRNLVPPAGRIKLAADEPAPPTDASVETAPRLSIEPAGLIRGEPAGSILQYVQIWRLVITTSDPAAAPAARIKFVIAAALEAAGPGLGLPFVAGWTISGSQEEPDSTDRKPYSPGRRVVLVLRVRVRPSRADATAWLGAFTGPVGERLRLFVNEAAVGDEVVGYRTRLERTGCATVHVAEFRIAVAAADAVALDSAVAGWSRTAGACGPGSTAELRDAANGATRVVFTRVQWASPSLPMPEPDDAGTVRVVEWAGRTFDEPAIVPEAGAIIATARCAIDAGAGIAAPARCDLSTGAAVAAKQRVGVHW
jgi:hypothetical protein